MEVRAKSRQDETVRCDVGPLAVKMANVMMAGCTRAKPMAAPTRLLTSETTKHRNSIYCEFLDSLALYDPSPIAVCVRDEQYKMVYYQNLPIGELYDLENDPAETNNLWNVSSSRTAREMMMQLTISRMIDTVDPRPERKCMW